MAKHLGRLKEQGRVVERGNLSMPSGATPEDHRAAKAGFLLSFKRWKERHGVRAEIHATLHITAIDAAHWDFHLWHDGSDPTTTLASFLRKSWESQSKGGVCTLVEADDLDASARYQSKPVLRDRNKPHLIPAARRDCGLESTWYTSGFWDGQSVDEIWKAIIAEWLASNTDTNLTDTPPKVYVPGENPKADRQVVNRYLPRKVEDSIGLGDFAYRLGFGIDYLKEILAKIPGVVVTGGELLQGKHHYNTVYMPDTYADTFVGGKITGSKPVRFWASNTDTNLTDTPPAGTDPLRDPVSRR
ncbi:hypothetical protein [Planctomyces sp. SH-PL62]|uniref:hypothetical protein n=1 Tax=Planctomyces sp. SH-PL62 TaxID=1636152 RepID=UPI0012E896A7|nr:hypothetical protein [Planctomyces sp. SH-PL62]